MGKPKRDTGNWLVTYGDLMTLLLVFFVLMYTLTPSIEEGVFKDFIEYFQSSPGFFDAENVNSAEFDVPSDAEELEEMLEERIEHWQALADFFEKSEFSSEVNVEISSSGVKITLSDSLTFESGSSELLPNAAIVLSKVANNIDNQILEIEVQGHTDNMPIKNISIHKTNWHLGAARAVSVVEFLQGNSVVDSDRFKASSFGEYSPVAENDTETGRRKNRRVEIYLRDQLLTNDLFKNSDIWF